MSCSAAALATLELFERERVIEKLQPKIALLAQELQRLERLPGVGEIRQYGLAAGIELVADRQRRTPHPAKERRGFKVCLRARERGVFLRPLADVIVLMPPLSITPDEIRTLVDAVAYGIKDPPQDAR